MLYKDRVILNGDHDVDSYLVGTERVHFRFNLVRFGAIWLYLVRHGPRSAVRGPESWWCWVPDCMPEWGAETVALWVLHSYAFELREVGGGGREGGVEDGKGGQGRGGGRLGGAGGSNACFILDSTRL